jgi:hypothetical protein
MLFIMRPERYDPEALISMLRQRKIATMEDLKAALGTTADATVFRKLAGLEYRTSYSYRGRYYTLDEVARFDEVGCGRSAKCGPAVPGRWCRPRKP